METENDLKEIVKSGDAAIIEAFGLEGLTKKLADKIVDISLLINEMLVYQSKKDYNQMRLVAHDLELHFADVQLILRLIGLEPSNLNKDLAWSKLVDDSMDILLKKGGIESDECGNIEIN